MTEQEITQYLVKKYQPHAILLHGSRVGNREVTPETDWDLLLIHLTPETVQTEVYAGQLLDASAIPPSETTYRSGLTPIWPLQLLYDDAAGFGQRLVANNQQVYNHGPAVLSAEELTNRRNFLSRLIGRLERRQHDPIPSLIYKANVAQRACRYWCELRQIWPQNEYRVMPLIHQQDADFAALLEALNSSDAVKIARAIYQRLFG